MKDASDREFYPSPWRRVLPIGPEGIQPYVRTGRRPLRSATGASLRRALASLTGPMRDVLAPRGGMARPTGGAAKPGQC